MSVGHCTHAPHLRGHHYYLEHFGMLVVIVYRKDGWVIYIFMTTSRQMAVKCLVLRGLII